jgi:hypothetical protein
MGKRNRHKASRTGESGSLPSQAVPDAVLHGAELIVAEAKKTGEMKLALPAAGYRHADQFDIAGNKIEIGLIGSARQVDRERVRQVFKFASAFAARGRWETQSFDPKNGQFKPATVRTREQDVDGYLIYIPRGMARAKQGNRDIVTPSFTTGMPILSEGEPLVSFVTSDATVRPAARTISAATESVQNRCLVEGVTFGRGKTHTDTSTIHSFQENLANGIGSAAGAIMLGWTYGQYEDFLDTYDRSTPLWGGSIKGALGRRTPFIAPHLMLGQATYDQLADGELPSEPVIVPRQPVELR